MNKAARIQCLTCGDILQSQHRHDYKGCSCHNTTGEMVERCAAKIKEALKLDDHSSEYHLIRCYINDEFGTGITVDGGNDYLRMGYSRRSKYKVLDDEE